MGYSSKTQSHFEGDCAYRVMEVVMMKNGKLNGKSTSNHLLFVDNSQETLKFVQESMDDIISNIIKVKKMRKNIKKIDENAKLFEQNLDPLFSVMAESTQGSILDKLSLSLKKALILMAMDRYKSDKKSVCKALGITHEKLEGEMELCGLMRERRAA
jgi:DNA-binding NtrC family response regulator